MKRINIKFMLLLFVLFNSLLQGFGQSEVAFAVDDIFYHLQQHNDSLGSEVNIFQDPELHLLLNRRNEINKKEKGIPGYRIQIFSITGQDARTRINEERSRFLELYNDITPHIIVQTPYWKIRVGDFRTRSDAYVVYKELVRNFPNSYIVRDNIDLPPLK